MSDLRIWTRAPWLWRWAARREAIRFRLPAPVTAAKDRSLSLMVDEAMPRAGSSFTASRSVTTLSRSRTTFATRSAWRSGSRTDGNSARGLPARSPLEPVRPITTYVYEDDQGRPYLRVTRMSDKTFRQAAHWDGEKYAPGKPAWTQNPISPAGPFWRPVPTSRYSSSKARRTLTALPTLA